MNLWFVFALFLSVLGLPPAEYKRCLLVHDSSNTDVSVSSLEHLLTAKGYSVDVKSPTSRPELVKYGENLYDNLVIVPGKTKSFGKTLKTEHFLEFVKNGGNLVMLSTPQYSPTTLREVAKRFGIEIGTKGVRYEDHFGEPVQFSQSNILPAFEANFTGSAVAKLGDSELLMPLVCGSKTSYSWNALKDEDEIATTLSNAFALGHENVLAAGLQSLKNSRIVWVGSPSLLNNENAGRLLSWAFHETGQLSIGVPTHEGANNGASEYYDVEEDLKFCAPIYEWNPATGSYELYKNMSDVQLEFKMLDPYYRLNLGDDGCVEFKAPDQYGMFTFGINYMRKGLTFLNSNQVVTVLHKANDAWPRSWTITNSWVYLGGVTTTVMGFIAFIIAYAMAPEPEFKKTAKPETEKAEVVTETPQTPKAKKNKKSKN